MAHTLDQLDKAIQGTVVMSQPLEDMANRFNDDKVPDQWENVGYPCLKPLSSWIPDLIKRVEFISSWLYSGPPATFWLPSFFFPQGFMTAAMQTYARKTATAIDTLQFKSHVVDGFEDSITEAPEDGVNLHGLFLEGCGWSASRNTLEDSAPKVAIAPFPVMWLQPVDVNDNVVQGNFECPLYKTSTRKGELSTTGHSTNFVCFMQVPTEVDSNHWLRRGVALLCMTDI
jgi:dynein heavy chain